MENLEVRILVADSGFSYKTIAAHMGISHQWLSHMMAKPLTPQGKARILKALSELKEGMERSYGQTEEV